MATNSEFNLPKPDCHYGYTTFQLMNILGQDFDAFQHWMRGQTMTSCDGNGPYNHETKTYGPPECNKVHGFVVYPWDLERFILGLPVID